MRNLANLRQLLVDGMWNDEAGKPGVCLWCGDRKDMPEGKLRSLLFAWHKGSWYGSDIDEARTNGQSMLKLSPLQAMDGREHPYPFAEWLVYSGLGALVGGAAALEGGFSRSDAGSSGEVA
jgi:hypothetical protein